MKDYIYQFYNEGLATIFYLKPKKFLSKYIKNEIIQTILITLLDIFYTVLVLSFAAFYLYKKLK